MANFDSRKKDFKFALLYNIDSEPLKYIKIYVYTRGMWFIGINLQFGRGLDNVD